MAPPQTQPPTIIFPPKLERKIQILLKNGRTLSERQSKILLGILEKTKRGLTGKKPGEISAFKNINIFLLPEHSEQMTLFNQNIAKMFNFGIKFSEEVPSSTVKALEEAMVQSSNGIVSKLGVDIRERALAIVNEGTQTGQLPDRITKQLQEVLDLSKARAKTIARTETMRAGHSASYSQARRDGQTHYIIDNRAEACELCQEEYEGQVFSIDDTGALPPLHPNCACVPVYFSESDEAQGYADELTNYNQEQRTDIIDSGEVIKPDGTSQHVHT